MNRLFKTRRRFLQLGTASLLGLSTSFVLSNCDRNSQQAETSGTNVSASTSEIKTDVLRMGYQQAGDLVRVSGVLEKRLEPLGVKVEWLQFAQGPQLMEGMNAGRVDLGSVGNTPPIYAQAAGADIVYVVGRVPPVGRYYAFVAPPLRRLKTLRISKVKR